MTERIKPIGILCVIITNYTNQIHTIRLMSDHFSLDISKHTFRMGSLVRKTIVVARRCKLSITRYMYVLPHIHNTNIFNRYEADQNCIHKEGKQSNHHLHLIIKKNIPLEQPYSGLLIERWYSENHFLLS